jgi:hypothetical protein
MQMPIHLHSHTTAHKWHFPRLRWPFKRFVRLREQMSADELVERLQYALTTQAFVTIQLNRSLFSEQVENLTGTLRQSHNGELWLREDRRFFKVPVRQLRHIHIK